MCEQRRILKVMVEQCIVAFAVSAAQPQRVCQRAACKLHCSRGNVGVVEDVDLCGRCRRIRGSSMTYTSRNELPTSSNLYLFVSLQMTYLTKRIDISIDKYIIFIHLAPPTGPQVQLVPSVYDHFFKGSRA